VAEDEGQDKTHDPTGKRIQEFRDRGQVPKSQEVTTTIGLMTGGIAMLWAAPYLGQAVSDVFMISYARIPERVFTPSEVLLLFGAVGSRVLAALAPPVLVYLAVMVVAGYIQQRGAFPKEPFKDALQKLNPISAFKEKFLSAKPFVELLKSLLKLLLIGWLVFSAVRDRFGFFPALITQDIGATLLGFREMVILVLTRAIPVAIVVATIDYLYEWYRLYEQMKMTREEIKEEQKSTDGDPQMKAARRQRQREIAMAQTIRNVPKADVVITNPTHYAVALRYRKDEAPAPVVVAMGVDHLALKIRVEAQRHDIPQIENRPLARALHAKGKEGQMIPEDLYGAVARVLAVVWKRKNKRGARREISRERPR
jgi:flagellar biosynthetic protein FlhB